MMYQNEHRKKPAIAPPLLKNDFFPGLKQLSRVLVPLVGMVIKLFTFCCSGGRPCYESAHLLLLEVNVSLMRVVMKAFTFCCWGWQALLRGRL